jgi:hypothetical protein
MNIRAEERHVTTIGAIEVHLMRLVADFSWPADAPYLIWRFWADISLIAHYLWGWNET